MRNLQEEAGGTVELDLLQAAERDLSVPDEGLLPFRKGNTEKSAYP
jgi:hypothetical protein